MMHTYIHIWMYARSNTRPFMCLCACVRVFSLVEARSRVMKDQTHLPVKAVQGWYVVGLF
jgi:hypothetical protein